MTKMKLPLFLILLPCNYCTALNFNQRTVGTLQKWGERGENANKSLVYHLH